MRNSDFEEALDMAITTGKLEQAWLDSLSEEDIDAILREHFDFLVDQMSTEEMSKLLGWYDY